MFVIFYIQLNHLVSLAKWLSVRLRTKWLWVRVPLQSLKFVYIVVFDVKTTPYHAQLRQGHIQVCFDSMQLLRAPRKIAEIFLQVQMNNCIFH